MKYILAALGAIGVLALSTILHGWVLTCLWGWFVVPFFGVSTLPLVYAVGLTLIVRLMTYHIDSLDSKFKASNLSQIGVGFLTPIVTLTLGWIVQMFI